MRIGIDGRFFGPEGTGIGRYTEKLIENLEILDNKNDYFIFLRKANFSLYNPGCPNFHKVLSDVQWYSLKEQVVMPASLLAQKLDLVHFPQINIPLLYPGKFVVTLHDLTKINFRDQAATLHSPLVYQAKHLAFTFILKQALKRAQMIFTPSEFVKNELSQTMKIDKNKIVTTYESADDFALKFFPGEGMVKEVLGRYSIKSPYILYLGNAYPHKNLERLMEALLKIDPQVTLVCIIKRDVFSQRITAKAKNLGIRNRVVFVPGVSDEYLKVFLSQAECLVFPSLSEGFGLPGLEAMAVGCPVVAANATSLPEVYQEAAVYFDPYNVADIASKVSSVIKNEKMKIDLRKKGREQVKKYSWKKMAEDTLKAYNTLSSQ